MLGVAKVDQGVEALDRFEDDVAALAAVAAVGPAIFDEFLAPEADRAGAAGARADEDLGLVEKMHGGHVGQAGPKRNPSGRAKAGRAEAALVAPYLVNSFRPGTDWMTVAIEKRVIE